METFKAVRGLVTVETVTAMRPIENADFIVRAKIRGWNLVMKKDEATTSPSPPLPVGHTGTVNQVKRGWRTGRADRRGVLTGPACGLSGGC
jgi:hypothetical protein